MARGEQHSQVFELLGVEAPEWPGYERDDFYPDALPCLVELRRRGYRVGIAGNQPQSCEQFLREAEVDVDCIGTSAGWGVRKPEPEFFARVVTEAGVDPDEIAYVGDRVDFESSLLARPGSSPCISAAARGATSNPAASRQICVSTLSPSCPGAR